MKKIYRLFALICALCAAVGVLALSACGDGNESGTVNYTVTVRCEENTTVPNGLNIRLKTGETVAAEKSAKGGTVTFALEKGTYTVELVEAKNFEGLLLGYTYTPVTLTPDKPTATIDIVPAAEEAENIAYSVKVLKPDGTPAANVRIQLCGGPADAYACHDGTTGSDGVASFTLLAGNYDIHIDTPPEGFAFDNNAYKMTEKGGSAEVYLTAAE